jgi:hypothetical protein
MSLVDFLGESPEIRLPDFLINKHKFPVILKNLQFQSPNQGRDSFTRLSAMFFPSLPITK